MTADTDGGVWTYALELANALAEHDVEVVLASMGGPLRPDQRRQLRGSRVTRAYASDFALEWMNDPWRDVDRAGTWLLRIRDEVEPDLVHLNSYAHAALPWELPVLVVGHSDVLSWHAAVRGRPAGGEWARYRAAVAAGLDAADLLVAPTQAMLDELIRLYEPAAPRVVIPNGSSRPLPLRPKDELVLTAGRAWDDAKNVQALERVAPRLEWRVAFARGGVGRGLLDELYRRASIFAEPARYEPFGLAALEAGRAGCALVLGDIPSLREVWADAALYVRPDDEDALESTLASLIRDARSRSEHAVRARRRALSYSAERMARGYAGLYDRARVRAEV
jgi:glycosyltransferase involved in cell wall biosynthesis